MATIDYGTDTDQVLDRPLRKSTVAGKANLGRALARRLVTPRGALAAIGEDPNYGLDTRQLLHEVLTPALVAAWQAMIAAECKKDERVLDCDATITSTGQGALTIKLVVTTDEASAPFTYILGVSALTVTLLQAA